MGVVAMKISLALIALLLCAALTYSAARDVSPGVPLLMHYLNARTGLYDRREWMKWAATPRWLKNAALELQH